ncbi:MAG: DegT/DnrJ/EryC1/StrS family aminotransferase [Acidimicrobiales bacterium]
MSDGHPPIPLARVVISEDAIAAAMATLRSGWPGPGREVLDFEDEFAAATGAAEVIATSSGTAALELALALLALPAGAEVVTTPITFVATNHAVVRAGLVPVFADIDRRTGNVDAGSVASRIGHRTAAIVVVHYAGRPCDLDEIHDLASRHGVPVIEDCAHAAGATYRGAPIGSTHNGLCAFSFQATKNMTAVDGGALCLPDGGVPGLDTPVPDAADRARRLRWMGIDRSTYERHTDDGYQWDYDVTEIGFRATMSDLNAAMARVGLKELPAVNARRSEIAARYRDGLEGIDGVEALASPDDRTSSHHLFPVLTDERDRCLDHLRRHGIGGGVHYRSNDRFSVYDLAPVPEAHWFADHVLSLPMYPGLSDDDVDRVLDVLRTYPAG